MTTKIQKRIENDNDDLRLSDLLTLIKDTWLSALAGGFLAGAAALALSYWITPQYNVQVLLEYVGDPTKQERVRSGVGGLTGLAAIAGFNLGSDGNPKDAALATLRSWAFAQDFIETNSLAPVLNEKDWDKQSMQWRDTSSPPSEWRTVKRFRRDILYVADDAKTGLVSLNVEWKDPMVAAEWATNLVLMINTRLRETTVRETTRSIEHLKAELAQTKSQELQRAIAGLLQGQIEALMFADIRDEFVFRTIDPALPPPANEYVFPNHIVFLLVGMLFGGFAGVILRILRLKKKAENADA